MISFGFGIALGITLGVIIIALFSIIAHSLFGKGPAGFAIGILVGLFAGSSVYTIPGRAYIVEDSSTYSNKTGI